MNNHDVWMSNTCTWVSGDLDNKIFLNAGWVMHYTHQYGDGFLLHRWSDDPMVTKEFGEQIKILGFSSW